MTQLHTDTPVSQEPRPLNLASEVGAIRMQAALVRSLLEELDEIIPPGSAASFGRSGATQAVEELTQLACRMLTVAASIAPQRVTELCLSQWSHAPKNV